VNASIGKINALCIQDIQALSVKGHVQIQRTAKMLNLRDGAGARRLAVPPCHGDLPWCMNLSP
jgi:hypothetical protein